MIFDMRFLSWFIFGILISTIGILSINRAIAIVCVNRVMKTFWVHYILRFLFVSLALSISAYWSTSAILGVCAGFIFSRLLILSPAVAKRMI
jgi:hypothetical protein